MVENQNTNLVSTVSKTGEGNLLMRKVDITYISLLIFAYRSSIQYHGKK